MFLHRCSRHQVAHSLPEAWVPCGSIRRFLLPSNGGALVNETLELGVKTSVSLRPRIAHLDQDHVLVPVHQRILQSHLQNNTVDLQTDTLASKNNRNVVWLCTIPTCQSNPLIAEFCGNAGVFSVISDCDTELSVRMAISLLLCFIRSSASSRLSVG